MIFELQALSPVAAFPDLFSQFPAKSLGLLLWLVFTILALVYGLCSRRATEHRLIGIPISWILAAGAYAGMFIRNYNLIDEVSINLEHPYNLFHYGRFSMSPDAWVEGTVEFVYYLLHAPFAASQRSLLIANYGISFLVGLLHIPVLARVLGRATDPANRSLALCGFAGAAPLIVMFSSGFGNGLVSLLFVAGIAAALEGHEKRSLILSGCLPLLRPDAVLLSIINIAVILWWRRQRLLKLIAREELPLLCLPLASISTYYSFCRIAFGHWVPTPIRFKTLTPAMLRMTDFAGVASSLIQYVMEPPHAIMLACLVGFVTLVSRSAPGAARKRFGSRSLQLMFYSLATLPVLLFYTLTRNTIGDFSFQMYSRYWIVFEIATLLLTLTVFSSFRVRWLTDSPLAGRVALLSLVVLNTLWMIGFRTAYRFVGRSDSVFAGAFTERYLPGGLTIATTEMDTFGLMIERPVIDLWGYTNPAIAFSKHCNGDRIRANGRYFLDAKPDVFWPYWFTAGVVDPARQGDYDSVERSLATFPHTSRHGDLLGDMRDVLQQYDVVIAKANGNQVAYLVRREARNRVVDGLLGRGFTLARQRALDMDAFRKLYEAEPPVSYPCG